MKRLEAWYSLDYEQFLIFHRDRKVNKSRELARKLFFPKKQKGLFVVYYQLTSNHQLAMFFWLLVFNLRN